MIQIKLNLLYGPLADSPVWETKTKPKMIAFFHQYFILLSVPRSSLLQCGGAWSLPSAGRQAPVLSSNLLSLRTCICLPTLTVQNWIRSNSMESQTEAQAQNPDPTRLCLKFKDCRGCQQILGKALVLGRNLVSTSKKKY